MAPTSTSSFHRFKATTLLVFALFSTPALAAPGWGLGGRGQADRIAEELLQQPNRPSMSQIAKMAGYRMRDLEAAAAEIEAQRKAGQHNIDFNGWLKIIKSQAPSLVAATEFAFPGATFAFIGRDSQALADVFEAFYNSIGQPGRVARLGLSKASFVNSSDETLVDFMKSSGFSFENLNEKHPYILIDTVSQGGGRQGRKLLDAVYTEYARRGGSPADLVRKFNMIGLVVSTYQGKVIPIENAHELLDAETERFRKNPRRPRDGYGPGQLILNFVDRSNQKFNEAGYEHFTGAWHASYGEMSVTREGRTEAQVGPSNALDLRKAILLFQVNILDAVSDNSFLSHVKAEARNLRYTFTTERPAPTGTAGRLMPEQPATPEEFAALIEFNASLESINGIRDYEAQLRDYLEQFRKAENSAQSTQTLNYLLQTYLSWIPNNAQPNVPTLAYLKIVHKALEQKKILPSSIPAALEPIFAHCTVTPRILEATRDLLIEWPEYVKLFQPTANNGSWMKGKLGKRTYDLMAYGLLMQEDSLAEAAAKQAEARAKEVAARIARSKKQAQDFLSDMDTRFGELKAKLYPADKLPRFRKDAYFTENAEMLVGWLDNELRLYGVLSKDAPEEMKATERNHIPLFFTAEITHLRDGQSISSKDYRRLLARAFSASEINPMFLKAVGTIYAYEATLQDCLKEQAKFFLTTYKNKKREGTENTEAVYREIRAQVMKMPVVDGKGGDLDDDLNDDGAAQPSPVDWQQVLKDGDSPDAAAPKAPRAHGGKRPLFKYPPLSPDLQAAPNDKPAAAVNKPVGPVKIAPVNAAAMPVAQPAAKANAKQADADPACKDVFGGRYDYPDDDFVDPWDKD